MTREEYDRLTNIVFSVVRVALPNKMDRWIEDLRCGKEDVAESLIADIKDYIPVDDYVD